MWIPTKTKYGFHLDILLILILIAAPASHSNPNYFQLRSEPSERMKSDVFFKSVDLSIAGVPSLNRPVELVLKVETPDLPKKSWDRILSENGSRLPEVGMEVVLPEGFEFIEGSLSWRGYISPNEAFKLKSTVKAVKIGDWVISGWAGPCWYPEYDRANLYISVSGTTATVQSTARPLSPSSEMSMTISTTTLSRLPAPAPSGYIVIYGIWRYTGWTAGPIRNAMVELYDDDPLGPVKLGETYTGSDGYFEFTAIYNDDGWFEDGYDVWVKLKVETDPIGGLYVTDGSSTYWARTPKVSNIASGTWSITGENTYTSPLTSAVYTVNDANTRGSLGIYHSMLDEYLWLRFNSGVYWIQPKIKVNWPASDTGFNDYYVNIELGNEWDMDACQHEYAHAVMFKLCGRLPSG